MKDKKLFFQEIWRHLKEIAEFVKEILFLALGMISLIIFSFF